MIGDAPQPPFRIAFDAARDPYTARNTLGIPEPAAAPDLTIYALKSDFPAEAWTAWTPTITPGTGALTSTSINRARYVKAGKKITAHYDVNVDNAGTGNGALFISLPVTASASGGGSAYGREINTLGVMLIGVILPSYTTVGLLKYDGSTVIGTGNRYCGIMVYEGA